MSLRARAAVELRPGRLRRATGARGFTLVELAVVLVLLGVMAAVSVPVLARMDPRTADGALAELDDLWERARAEAAARGIPVHLTLEVAGGHYLVTASKSGSVPEDTLERGRFEPPARVRVHARGEDSVTWSVGPAGRARGGPLYLTDGEDEYEVRPAAWTAALEPVRR